MVHLANAGQVSVSTVALASNKYGCNSFVPLTLQRRSCCRKQTHRIACQAASTFPDRGASGIDIAGARPTSPRAWEVITERLRRKVTFLSPQDALAMQKRGVPVIDIRPEPEWAVSRVRGSVGVPFMRLIKGNSFRKNLRRAGFAFFGIFQGTEFNPHFYDQVAASVDKKKGAVIVCNYGGTLLPLGEGGRQSRSIHAAYELVEQGYSSICILDGGFGAWQKEDLPVDDAPAPEASTDA